ncbi:carbon-nitrogen hydrolase [Tricladium varicosporioides]|nr:carbon-nitrogen hydrolase [Hymenoscyphus varicosporioides]
MTASKTKIVRVAVTQAEPEWLNLEKSVLKTCRLVEEAAANGAQLVTFPELWIPGYPSWVWARSIDFKLGTLYLKNSLKVKSPEMDRIRTCAAENHITICLGFSENYHNSLYIAQSIIGSDGDLKLTRRKIKPTHMERTVFGDASGDCLRNVVDTEFARVGALACWEHTQPLLKYHTYLQREQIHVAAWPTLAGRDGEDGLWSMSRDGARALSQTYAIESQSFVLHTTAVIGQAGIDLMRTSQGAVMNSPGGGSSAIFGPDGKKLSEDITEGVEGIIYGDLELDDILKAKLFLDTCGHYSRPDILYLGVDDQEKSHLRVQN